MWWTLTSFSYDQENKKLHRCYPSLDPTNTKQIEWTSPQRIPRRQTSLPLWSNLLCHTVGLLVCHWSTWVPYPLTSHWSWNKITPVRTCRTLQEQALLTFPSSGRENGLLQAVFSPPCLCVHTYMHTYTQTQINVVLKNEVNFYVFSSSPSCLNQAHHHIILLHFVSRTWHCLSFFNLLIA